MLLVGVVTSVVVAVAGVAVVVGIVVVVVVVAVAVVVVVFDVISRKYIFIVEVTAGRNKLIAKSNSLIKYRWYANKNIDKDYK